MNQTDGTHGIAFPAPAGGVGGLLFLARMLRRDFPPGLLQEFLDLPWPFT